MIDRAGSEVGLKYPTSAGAGRLIYFVQESTPANSELRLLRLDDGSARGADCQNGRRGRYDRARSIYKRGRVWIGQAFDPASGRLMGDGEPVHQSTARASPRTSVWAQSLPRVGTWSVGNVRREQRQATWVSRSGAVSRHASFTREPGETGHLTGWKARRVVEI